MKSFVCRGCMNPVTSTGRTSVDIGVNANLQLVDKFFRWHVECKWRCWCSCGDQNSNWWNKFRQLVPLLINKDISLIVRGRLYSSCVQSSMLHGSETWPVRKSNEVKLQRAEMRMVRWMCGVKLQDRVPSKGLRERLGLDNIILILQENRLRCYGHVLWKEGNNACVFISFLHDCIMTFF